MRCSRVVSHRPAAVRDSTEAPVVARFETVPLHRVILWDFSPEGSGAHRQQRKGKGVSVSRQILHGLKAVQDDACGKEKFQTEPLPKRR